MHLLAFLLASCTPDATSPPEHPSAGPGALADDASQRLPMLPDQAAYGGRWLAILGSYPAPGSTPASLATLKAHPELEAAPARIDSSRFKGLQPCLEVVVAQAFDDVESARRYATRLSAAGVDHYLKNAGAHVADDPRVEAYCASRDAPTGAGPGGLRFAIAADGRVQLPLLLDDVGVERALVGASKPRKLDEAGTLWVASLPAKTLGDVSIGDAWAVVDAERGGPPRRCRVTAFAALTRGQPHFGWYEGGQPDVPGCGEPAPFAVTDCDAPVGDAAWLATPASTAPPQAVVGEQAAIDGALLAQADPGYLALWTAIGAEAELREAPLVEHWRATVHGEDLLVQVELTTGEGNDWCGSDDVNASLAAVYAWKNGTPGSLRLPWRATTGAQIHGLVQLGDSRALATVAPFGGRVLLGADGPLTRLDEAYCDCPC